MKQRSAKARGPAKPADTDCTLASHQEIARTTLFKVCPECGEQLGPHRLYPVEQMKTHQREALVANAVTSMASEDEQFVSTMAGGVRDFLRGMAGFFVTAQDIEKDAQHTVAEFERFVQPTNLEEDERLVSKIRSANVAYDVAKNHWDPVASMFNNLHKRITAGRKRTLDKYDTATARGNSLHNRYTAEADRIAREKEEAQRRENERIAREARDREIREREEAAERAEANAESLSAREQTFVDLVARQNHSPRAAATRAGFKGEEAGARLMGLVKIVNAIDGIKTAASIRQQAAALAHAPLETKPVEKEQAQVATRGRTTRTADVYDPGAFLAALLDPTQRAHYGIPAELATWDQPKLNQQARSLDKQINRWPGVRLHEETGVV